MESRTADTIDEFNAVDAKCLFRSISFILHRDGSWKGHVSLMLKCIEYMKTNRDLLKEKANFEAFDLYMNNLTLEDRWAHPAYLHAASMICKVNLTIFKNTESVPVFLINNNFENTIALTLEKENFYDEFLQTRRLKDPFAIDNVHYGFIVFYPKGFFRLGP